MIKKNLPFFSALATLAIPFNVYADKRPGESDLMDWLTGDYLLGTWGGVRTDLQNAG